MRLDPIPQVSFHPANFTRLDWVNGSAFFAGGRALGVQIRSDNIWNRASTFTNQGDRVARYGADAELEEARFAYRWSPAPSWQVAVEGAVGIWCGGWMDGPIEAFHLATSNRDHARPETPRNLVAIDSGAWKTTNLRMDLAPVVFRPQWTFFESTRHAFALRADFLLPLGEWCRGRPGAPGFGGGLRYSGKWKRWQWDGGAGFALQDADATAPENLSQNLARGFLDAAISVSFRSGLTFVYGLRYASPLYGGNWYLVPKVPPSATMNEFISSGYNALFTPAREITMALRYDRPSFTAAITLVEDLWPASTPDWTDTVNNAPDLGLGLYLAWRL
ncbi:MAG: hypothetical protein J0L75_18765 [Spirochaetes bacterium]|nr:hypothetical protein [Spirochaetota bacterium]